MYGRTIGTHAEADPTCCPTPVQRLRGERRANSAQSQSPERGFSGSSVMARASSPECTVRQHRFDHLQGLGQATRAQLQTRVLAVAEDATSLDLVLGGRILGRRRRGGLEQLDLGRARLLELLERVHRLLVRRLQLLEQRL